MTHRPINKIIAMALAIASAAPASAQKVRKLSLSDAIQLSIQNSGKLKVANAKVDEAIANYHEAWNNHLPDVKVTGAYMRLNSPNVDLKIKTGSSGPADTTKQTSSISVTQAAYGIVNASLPLFSGFRIKYGAESAKFLEQATKLDAENDKEDVMLLTVNAYANLFKAERTVVIIRDNLKQQQQRVTDFTNLEKNGLIARNDLLKTQLQQSNIELTVLEAENNLKIANLNMDLLLGLPEDTELTVDTTGFHIETNVGTAVQWEQTAIQNRKDVASLTIREKAADTYVKATKGEYYPGIALTGGYIAADVPGLLTLTNALNIGVGLSYNIGALWKTGAKVNAANARLHQVQYNESMLSDQVRSDINRSYLDYLLSLKKIEVYAKALEQANENYRITKNKYDNALATTTDLLEADVAQLQARLNHTLAQAGALVAYKQLKHTSGTLSTDFPTIK